MIRRSLGADLHRLADHRYIGLGLFAGEIDVLSDFLDLSFRRAREHVYDHAFSVRAANNVELLKAGRVQPTIRAAVRTYLYMRASSFWGVLFLHLAKTLIRSAGSFLGATTPLGTPFPIAS